MQRCRARRENPFAPLCAKSNLYYSALHASLRATFLPTFSALRPCVVNQFVFPRTFVCLYLIVNANALHFYLNIVC